ncbi:MAG: 16S rRNA (guanine(527)-N(7))-methyltransferase RsmG [Desulfobacterales bacterium]|jgi:16S rRNA (guanine527-N7)-methyltransferase|nr:16S rRNA (guanine(527)-N(7))-methyltransferase RsmG [Desulfobacterales bacterium]
MITTCIDPVNKNAPMKIGSKKWRNIIYEGTGKLGIPIEHEEIEKFSIHALELIKWNQKTNLTAITDPKEIAVKHFLDAIAPIPHILPTGSLLDIGSGGGFPGIPLKICLPSVSVTLIDASRKKINFVKHVIRILALENIDAFHVRAEDFAKKPERAHRFDVIISRALSSMTTFAATAIPFLKKDGVIIAMKGAVSDHDFQMMRSSLNNEPEVRGTRVERFELHIKRYVLPYLNLNRSMICLRKKNEP